MREELSEREKQVAAHLAAGLRVAGVASELCIAEITVRNHLRNIFAKLDVHSQPDLIALLRREPGLLGAYRGISGAGPLGERPLSEELEAVDRATAERLDEAFASHTGRAAMRAALHAVLPLDEERRRDGAARRRERRGAGTAARGVGCVARGDLGGVAVAGGRGLPGLRASGRRSANGQRMVRVAAGELA